MLTKVKAGDLLKIKNSPHSRRILVSDLHSNIRKPLRMLEPESIVLILEDSAVSEPKNKYFSVSEPIMGDRGTKVLYKNDIGYIIVNPEDKIVSDR